MKTKEEIIAQCKAEIQADIAAGVVPADVSSFGVLHDYVDGNCYGGFCDDELADAMIAHFGGRDEHECMPKGMHDLIDEVQDAVNAWLVAGRS